MPYKTGFASHRGFIRHKNQDSLFVSPEQGLFIIADGMGGHAHGELASKLAVKTISQNIALGKNLKQSIQQAHFAILKMAHNRDSNMGSTVVALHLKHMSYQVAWVGDSRAYLWDGDHLTQLSKDHSYVQQLADLGLIKQSALANHPQRHIITQALGSADLPEVLVETVHGVLRPRDQILLCSDGLSNELGNKDIGKILLLNKNEQKKADFLLERALKKGGSDNISIILVSAPGNKSRKPSRIFQKLKNFFPQ